MCVQCDVIQMFLPNDNASVIALCRIWFGGFQKVLEEDMPQGKPIVRSDVGAWSDIAGVKYSELPTQVFDKAVR